MSEQKQEQTQGQAQGQLPLSLLFRKIPLHELLAMSRQSPWIYPNLLESKLGANVVLDGSGSMNGAGARQTFRLFSELDGAGINYNVRVFGQSSTNDTRNADPEALKEQIRSRTFQFSSCTYPNAIPKALESMQTGSTKNILVFVCDGGFNGGATAFRDTIENAAKRDLLSGVLKVVLIFPSYVSAPTKKELKREISYILAVSPNKAELLIIDLPRLVKLNDEEKKSAMSVVLSKLSSHMRVPYIPNGYMGISDIEGNHFLVDRAHSASQIQSALLEQRPQVLVGMINNLLSLIRISALPVLVNQAYRQMHTIIMANPNAEIIVDGKSSTIRQSYVDKISAIMSQAADVKEKVLLKELKQETRKSMGSQLLEVVAKASSTKSLRIKIYSNGVPLPIEQLKEMITKASTDTSGYVMKEVLDLAFGKDAKVDVKDNDNGWPIPSKDLCKENGLDSREILLISFRRFFLAFGQCFKQTINGQILFTLCLFLVGSPDLEVPEVIKDLAKTILFDEKYLLSNLGLTSGSSGQSEAIKIPDSWFVPAIMNSIFNLIRMPDFPEIATFQKIQPQLERVWMTFRFRNALGKLLDHLTSVKNPYHVLKVEDGRTLFLYFKPDTSDWVIPFPALPNCLLDGLFPGVVVGETYNGLVSGARSLTWLDNPATEELHALMVKSAEEHFREKYSDGKTPNKKTNKWMKKYRASLHAPSSLKEGCEIDDCKKGANKPLGTDFVHLPLKKLKVLGAVSEEKKKEIMEMFARWFGKWRAEDLWQNLSEDEIKKRCTSRTQEIIDYFATLTLPKETCFRKLTKEEAFSLIVAMYPHLEPFRDNYWPTKRVDVEDVAAKLDSKTFKKVVPKELKKDDPALTLYTPYNADVVKVDIGHLWDGVANIYAKAMAPPPVTESATTAECCSCMCDFGRESGQRFWMPCGHVVCKSCHSSIMALIDKSIDDTKTVETAGIAMNLCLCPVCRGHSILPNTDKYSTLRAFFDSKTPVVTGGIYRDCKECKGIFQAGHKNCLGHPGAIQNTCEKCSKVEYFTCPNCNMPAQHGGGCRIMRCCGSGGYHCPAEDGDYCSHCTCGDSMCTDETHTRGCGHEWTIDEDVAALGNGGDGMGFGEMRERVQQGADA